MFVIQQIPRDSQLGTIIMLGRGLFLILMGAVFEKTRATLKDHPCVRAVAVR